MNIINSMIELLQYILCIEAWKAYVCGHICVTVYFMWIFLTSVPKVPNLCKKSILITGCDTGFGRALAVRLEELGCQVFAGCLTPEGVTSLNETGSGRLVPIQMDVTDNKQIEEAYQVVLKHLPRDKGKCIEYTQFHPYLFLRRIPVQCKTVKGKFFHSSRTTEL